jgi:hypothetical protein
MNTTNYSWWYETLNQVIFQNWLGWYVDAQTDINKFVYDSNTFTLLISVYYMLFELGLCTC